MTYCSFWLQDLWPLTAFLVGNEIQQQSHLLCEGESQQVTQELQSLGVREALSRAHVGRMREKAQNEKKCS